MKMNPQARRGFTLVELLVVIVIIAALAGLTAPMVISQRRKADQSEATNNAKQIGLALFSFENDYGSFPDQTTAQQVRDNTDTQLVLGNASSNDFFRQLVAAEVAQAETMFYAKTAFTRKPDNVMNANQALQAGEVGFGYIMNANVAFSTAGNPARPIIAAPLAFPFSGGQFDPDIFDFKAVVLRIDNSATSLPILRTSRLAQVGGGRNLLQTGQDTVWGVGVTPQMMNPLPRQ